MTMDRETKPRAAPPYRWWAPSPVDDPIQKVESVAKATGANVSSMLQDVLNKKRTEIDFINGAIVRHAKALGIPTPVNEVLTNLVKTIEKSYDKVVRS